MEKINILAPCDYALNIMKDNVSVGLTIKSIDYLSYGLPLINNIKGDTWKLINDEKIGLNICDGLILSRIDREMVLNCYRRHFTLKAFVNSLEPVFREFL